MNAAVIIPAFDEENSIGKVINDIPREPIINEGYDFIVGSRVLGHREKGALPVLAVRGQ